MLFSERFKNKLGRTTNILAAATLLQQQQNIYDMFTTQFRTESPISTGEFNSQQSVVIPTNVSGCTMPNYWIIHHPQ